MALTKKIEDIANAIREKQGKERYEYGEPPIIGYDTQIGIIHHPEQKAEIKYSHTSNINDEGVANGTYAANLDTSHTVSFPNYPPNTPIHVKLYHGTESTSYDWVCIFDGAVSSKGSSYSSSVTGKIGGGGYTTKDTAQIVEYDFTNETSSITFGFKSDGSQGCYGCYAICTCGEDIPAYDEEGEIQVPIYGEAPLIGDNSLTLAQMPDEIRTLSKINGELKTVTAKTAVSKGDMVQYSENSFTLSRIQNTSDPLDQWFLYCNFTVMPWGISWLKNGQGIFWQNCSQTSSSNGTTYSIDTYLLNKKADGTISEKKLGVFTCYNSSSSFLDWVLLDDGKTVVPIAIEKGYYGTLCIGTTGPIDITSKDSFSRGLSIGDISIGESKYYGGVLNCKSKTIETDTQYKIYFGSNYQNGSGSGHQYCGCIYIDKTTGDVTFDTLLNGTYSGFGLTSNTDNSMGVIFDVQEIDAESHSYCSFISLQSSGYGQLYIHQRSNGSTSQQRTLYKHSASSTPAMFLPRNSISDPVMWAYIEPSDMKLHIKRWNKDKGEPMVHQDALVLTTNSKAYGAAVSLKKFSDNIYMVIANSSNSYMPSLYLYWDMETYTMSILGKAGGAYRDGENMSIGSSTPTIELFPNISHTDHQYWLKGCNTDHPQMFRKFQNELIKLDEDLSVTTNQGIYNFSNITYSNVLKTVSIGDGQFAKLHNNDFALEPVSKSNIYIYTIDNTPTIGNLLASDNPTGFAVAAEDIPAGGTGQAYVI